ncbi:MAG: DUF1501 domain-containing protein [Phycisphaerales bacterium JB059]
MTLHNDPSSANAYTRREFLHSGLTMASAAIAVPHFLQRSALALPSAAPGLSSIPGVNEDRVLVVCQLGGGNDGLNTVIPFRQDAYYRARPGIALRGEGELLLLSKIGSYGSEGLALQRAMAGVNSLYDDGLCTVVQGVGYPNPNRSHFKSMDIWQTGDTSGTGDGWLGRYIDSECCGYGKGESGRDDGSVQDSIDPPIAIGRTAPLALEGGRVKPVAFETADLFRWMGEDVHDALVDPYEKLAQQGVAPGTDPHSNAAFLMRTTLDAQVSSDQIRQAVSRQPLVRYPGSNLGRQLQMVGSMIRSGLRTRVYYVTHGGFDTHSGQGGANGRHAQLLSQFADAAKAFYDDLKAQGNDGRVLTMCFSEFGRRVSQNASGGTDHGTAAPMFLLGPMVNAGVIGRHPSLTDLDQGDLKFQIDFRSVYRDVLDNWMGAKDPDAILEGRFKTTRVVKG